MKPTCEIHQLIWYNRDGFRWRCFRCLKRLKIASGVRIPDEHAREMFNRNGGRWPWEEQL